VDSLCQEFERVRCDASTPGLSDLLDSREAPGGPVKLSVYGVISLFCAACAPQGAVPSVGAPPLAEEWLVSSPSQRPPVGELDLVLEGPVLSGSAVSLRVTGARSDEALAVLLSTVGEGAGPCNSAGVCVAISIGIGVGFGVRLDTVSGVEELGPAPATGSEHRQDQDHAAHRRVLLSVRR